LAMGELSQRLKVSNGNVTGVVDRLEREGLVERQALPTDRRIYRVRLTAIGRLALAAMAERHEAWIDRLLRALSAAEIGQTMALLARLRQAVESAEEETVP